MSHACITRLPAREALNSRRKQSNTLTLPLMAQVWRNRWTDKRACHQLQLSHPVPQPVQQLCRGHQEDHQLSRTLISVLRLRNDVVSFQGIAKDSHKSWMVAGLPNSWRPSPHYPAFFLLAIVPEPFFSAIVSCQTLQLTAFKLPPHSHDCDPSTYPACSLRF